MLFHYGNCRQEIDRLKAEKSILSGQVTRLLGEIQEQRGVFDYRVAELEKQVADKDKQLNEIKVQSIGDMMMDEAVRSMQDKKKKKK